MKCTYKGWCCDKGEDGECLAAEDSQCDLREAAEFKRAERAEAEQAYHRRHSANR